MNRRRIAFVLKGYPRLSETFIAQEIRALELAGLDILIVSLRHPTEPKRHALHDEIQAVCHYLPEYLHQAIGRVARAAWRCRGFPGLLPTLGSWLRDLRRDFTRNRVRRFGQALVLAAELPDDVALLHAHFMHTPASVTRYAAGFMQTGWSCSAHARDIWTSPEWEKSEKLDDCAWCVTCTDANYQHLSGLTKHPERVELLYHGLDLQRFGPAVQSPSARDASQAGDPVVIVSVGRAVEKKGYDTLLHALALLPAKLFWRFEHAGGGDLSALKSLADTLGIAARINWHGPRSQEEVLALYHGADLFVLASKMAADGDRDGLPNVLVEAQSQGLACVATRISAIPELIESGVNGTLVEPGDAAELGAAIAELLRSPERRAQMGRLGEAKVRSQFSLQPGINRLAARFLSDLQQRARPARKTNSPAARALGPNALP